MVYMLGIVFDSKVFGFGGHLCNNMVIPMVSCHRCQEAQNPRYDQGFTCYALCREFKYVGCTWNQPP